MAQPSFLEMLYLYGVLAAFAAFIVTLFAVSISDTLAKPKAKAVARPAPKGPAIPGFKTAAE
jgi:hypothetical protein